MLQACRPLWSSPCSCATTAAFGIRLILPYNRSTREKKLLSTLVSVSDCRHRLLSTFIPDHQGQHRAPGASALRSYQHHAQGTCYGLLGSLISIRLRFPSFTMVAVLNFRKPLPAAWARVVRGYRNVLLQCSKRWILLARGNCARCPQELDKGYP
ncbi:uncharacterized protein HMPREF1120_05250 [Exophiala dermatitidis NIH/UT8656]|uniref:Uncharacterized protein n=1 Tax=Exophiala dermatitidis (strain ATCC 34100 / CBS 525.76 / NIH/UT8656) TaxID=858893 RepID=H6C0A8_EXODN|nr:uncharacterized protein HMPREF1120_05250 [Exophiala dermatitidis NIH/UT8656]EHY57203.1 hypothetical protein HMPREF1120_05250 [Exophiala dermatitidis NIH/UT8656]